MNRRSLRCAVAIFAICAAMTTSGETSAKQIDWADGGIARANLDGTSITQIIDHQVGRFAVSNEGSAIYYGGFEVRKATPHSGVDSFAFDIPDYSIFSSIAIDPIRSDPIYMSSKRCPAPSTEQS